jgi:transcriptional regulator with XRE-family HTH domain
MARTNRRQTRATAAARAERHATELASRLGKALKEARLAIGLTQAAAARRAGMSQATWSALETDGDARYTMLTWDRAAHAVGTRLSAYLPETSAADGPRDAVQLRAQELIIRTSLPGGWGGLPEEQIDSEPSRSRVADVILYRPIQGPREYALMEVIDWFDDVGAPTRAWHRRLAAVERYAIARMRGDGPVPRIGGCWVIRATRRNRQLIGEHRHFFRARFPGSGRAWLAALTDPTSPMPGEHALLWVSVKGERIYPARLSQAKPAD